MGVRWKKAFCDSDWELTCIKVFIHLGNDMYIYFLMKFKKNLLRSFTDISVFIFKLLSNYQIFKLLGKQCLSQYRGQYIMKVEFLQKINVQHLNKHCQKQLHQLGLFFSRMFNLHERMKEEYKRKEKY